MSVTVNTTAAVAPSKSFFNSTIGKKYIMAITGLIWSGFVMVHMLGNLLIFFGPEAYNAYSHALVTNKITYLLELILLLALTSHIVISIALTLQNKKARGELRYVKVPNGEKGVTKASQFMLVYGTIIFAFIISHLLTFKWGEYHEVASTTGTNMRDLYGLVMGVFSNPVYVIFYFIALVFLGLHLSHGIGSLFQSLGLRTDRCARLIRLIAVAYSLVTVLGFLSTPVYAFFFAK